MAVDVCSELSSSPRISFSHDLNNQQVDPDIEAAQKYIETSSESDFFFSIISPSKCLHELCSADEIFSNGKILPSQIKNKTHHQTSAAAQPHGGVVTEPMKIRLKELLECEVEDEGDIIELDPAAASGSKSFWHFRRSSSLNFESGRAKGLIKSIQFLSRSKSTGSVPNRKQSRISRTNHKLNHSKNKSQFQYYSYGASTLSSGQKKPPLGRTRSYGSGNVRISPVLNMPLPPSYFCRGNASLFGFCSLLCSGNDKKSKKKKAVS